MTNEKKPKTTGRCVALSAYSARKLSERMCSRTKANESILQNVNTQTWIQEHIQLFVLRRGHRRFGLQIRRQGGGWALRAGCGYCASAREHRLEGLIIPLLPYSLHLFSSAC